MQPPEAYEGLAEIYDELGFNRFSKLSFARCRDYLADSERTVSRLLDLACGTGHFAIAMAEKGVAVTGVDRAAGMLKAARRNAGRMSNPPRWILGEFTRFAAPGRYDLVTCWFDSLNHLLTDRQALACFRRVNRHLVPGGAFLFDVNTPAAFREQWNQVVYRSRSGYVYIERGIAEPDCEYARLDAEAFVRQGKSYRRLRMPFYQRAFTAERARRLLREAKFKRVHAEPFDREDDIDTTTRLFVIAER